MNLIKNVDGEIIISVSRRNLKHLLKALDLNVGSPSLNRRVNDTTTLLIRAEENEQHYNAEARQPEVRGKAGPGQENEIAHFPSRPNPSPGKPNRLEQHRFLVNKDHGEQ